MKRQILYSAFWFPAFLASGQGTFVYDQQATDPTIGYAGFGQPIQLNQPMGLSFTPTLTSVGFIQLSLIDPVSNGAGATVYLNLWAGSIGGTLLGSTTPVYIPDYFGNAPTNFFFSTPVSVTPGTTYYFQPMLEARSDNADAIYYHYGYSGGTMILNGAPYPPWDLWFREGIYAVPEPSPVWLAFLGSAIFLYARRKYGQKRSPV
ncbi:MAG: hypothetical protein KGJ60_04240 [Verrucomicrobiota bacterium]|nr:hypothetical protein [Verrucomicrobiota bacterium]